MLSILLLTPPTKGFSETITFDWRMNGLRNDTARRVESTGVLFEVTSQVVERHDIEFENRYLDAFNEWTFSSSDVLDFLNDTFVQLLSV